MKYTEHIQRRKWEVLNAMPDSPGIYLIHNKVNHHQYIGLSTNIRSRISDHLTPRSRKKSTVLGRAFAKYPAHCFQYFVIEFVHDIKDLEAREMYWISVMKPEYNMNAGGNGNTGRPVMEETRIKISIAAKRQWEKKTEDQKRGVIANLQRNRPKSVIVSDATKEKLRAANIGKKQSAETRQKRSEKLKVAAIGNQNGNKKIVSVSNGIEIQVYDSTKKAADSLGINPSCITGVLKGRRKTAAGFNWKYA